MPFINFLFSYHIYSFHYYICILLRHYVTIIHNSTILHGFNMLLLKHFSQRAGKLQIFMPLPHLPNPVTQSHGQVSSNPPVAASPSSPSHLQSYTQIFPCRLPSPKVTALSQPQNPAISPYESTGHSGQQSNCRFHLSLRSSKFNAPASSLYCLYHLLFRRPPALASLHSFPILQGLSRHWWKTLLSSLMGTPSQQFILVHPHS